MLDSQFPDWLKEVQYRLADDAWLGIFGAKANAILIYRVVIQRAPPHIEKHQRHVGQPGRRCSESLKPGISTELSIPTALHFNVAEFTPEWDQSPQQQDSPVGNTNCRTNAVLHANVAQLKVPSYLV